MLDTVAPVLLLILGIVALFIEITIIPGFGVIGLVGVGLTIWGSVTAINAYGAIWGGVAVVLALGLAGAGVWAFFRSKGARALIREEKIEGPSSQVALLGHLVGKSGVAVSDLRPSGIALIEGARLDVLGEGTFIHKGDAVRVVRIDTNSIIVTKAE
jgi:membrane-bound serine protease (ClpP class)